jgi:hypothetical protein
MLGILEGVVMELDDCTYSLLNSTIYGRLIGRCAYKRPSGGSI